MFLRKNKRFTLWELLLVIGLIGILAVVIVPKIGAVKDNVKTAGVDSNARIIQGYVQSVIENYSSDEADLLEEELVSVFEGDNVVNPFNKVAGVKEADSIGNGAGVVYSTSDNNKSTADSQWLNGDKNETLKGTVLVAAYPNPNDTDTLEVLIVPMDKNGKAIQSKKVIITP